jgi:hypothetical protein
METFVAQYRNFIHQLVFFSLRINIYGITFDEGGFYS